MRRSSSFGLVVGRNGRETARRRADRWNRRWRPGSRSSGCESAADRARGPGRLLRATSRRAARRATRRGARPRYHPVATTTGAPAGPVMRQAMETDSSVPPKCSLSSPGTASTPSRICTAVLRRVARRRRCVKLIVVAHRMLLVHYPRGTRAERPCALHGTSRDPRTGWHEARSSAGIACEIPQELAPFRLAAVAPASSGPIPQPVSMSARIL